MILDNDKTLGEYVRQSLFYSKSMDTAAQVETLLRGTFAAKAAMTIYVDAYTPEDLKELVKPRDLPVWLE